MYFKDLLIELQATNQREWQEAIPEWPNAPKSCDIYIKLYWEYVIDQRFKFYTKNLVKYFWLFTTMLTLSAIRSF